MKATEANLLAFIKRSPQFVIPIYQRTYSWTDKECRQLWEDILRTGANENISAHFVGSVVYIERGLYQVSSQSSLLVIDGQQRLTTITLLITALANALEGGGEPFDGFSQRKLRNFYLLNPEEEGEQHFKLILSQTDKTSLISILNQTELPKDYSIRVTENFKLFEQLLNERKDDLMTVCKGLAKLVVVDIALTRDRDNPQLIFESMNSTGRELSQADLIRNYILMGLEPNAALKIAFQDLRELKVDVAYPFLMELYRDYDLKLLSQTDFLTAVRLVESYVFRRVICAIPTNSMNKTFATFGKALDKGAYLESIQAHLLLLPSYRRFPSDEEFKRAFQTKDLYKFRSRSYWLRRLENHQRKERVSIDEYTIEHILPQNENLSLAWKEALGEGWQQIHQTYLHTLGNLTLTGYNSEYSDKAFTAKRDMKGGFKESPLKLNQGLGAIEQWDETAIRHRADLLSTMALAVWIAPKVTHETLESYKSKPVKAGYSIADYPQLTAGTVRDLFEAFRKEILALDSCVTEEFLKLYIAYKAETNFVDIVPQAKRLRISLNMPFSEINDPRGICKDVSAVGRWGNGDVEIGLADLAELPYVMGLVRQALERQMGSL